MGRSPAGTPGPAVAALQWNEGVEPALEVAAVRSSSFPSRGPSCPHHPRPHTIQPHASRCTPRTPQAGNLAPQPDFTQQLRAHSSFIHTVKHMHRAAAIEYAGRNIAHVDKRGNQLKVSAVDLEVLSEKPHELLQGYTLPDHMSAIDSVRG